MAELGEIVAAIDAFMALPKRIVGANSLPQWRQGYLPAEVEMKYPIEVEGELRGAQLMVIGFPRERDLKFRLGILFPGMICRLDYTDETHPNSISGILELGLPNEVTGPHYHSWPLNRRFFRGVTKPPQLHDAVPYGEPGRSFDAILRWFCADTHIDALPSNHGIMLPPAELV
jgi:hypothetical protein